MSAFPTVGQRAQVHGVLVRELVALRKRALARNADPADISMVFRQRAGLLRHELAGRSTEANLTSQPGVLEPVSVPPSDGADYSVWW